MTPSKFGMLDLMTTAPQSMIFLRSQFRRMKHDYDMIWQPQIEDRSRSIPFIVNHDQLRYPSTPLPMGIVKKRYLISAISF
jgi:hypothetical protein